MDEPTNLEPTFQEDNPFIDERVAREWINSVENEKGRLRDKEIYPRLSVWAKNSGANIIVEIGSGQGICSEKLEVKDVQYLGIEPSPLLVERANNLYSNVNRKFIIGDAYALPLESGCADAVFSVNVWFHLQDLGVATKEMARILKVTGKFLIITANPFSHQAWRSFYINPEEDEKRISGKVIVPINPLSMNIFYKHSINDITSALHKYGLNVEIIDEFGNPEEYGGNGLFIGISGTKI